MSFGVVFYADSKYYVHFTWKWSSCSQNLEIWVQFFNILPPISKKLIFSVRKKNFEKSSLLFCSWAACRSNHVRIFTLAPPEKSVLGFQNRSEAFGWTRFLIPLEIQFWVWRLENYPSRLNFRCWIQKALCWVTKL